MSKNKLKVKKPSWWEEFKTFAVKGNAMALAIGTIIGAGFKTIVDSLTNHIIMPVVSIFLGDIDFKEMYINLGEAKVDETTGEIIQNRLYYGEFISAVINFFILALIVFFMVKGLNKLTELGKKKEEEAPAAPPEPSNEEKLLTEIRDLLKDK